VTGGYLDDFNESFREIVLSEKLKPARRSFSDEFKRDAVDLVVRQGCSFKPAADVVGVSSRSLREWHGERASEPQPYDEDASADLLREENRRLKKWLQRAEMERNTLRKHGLLDESPRRASRGMLLRQRRHGTFLLVTQTRVGQARNLRWRDTCQTHHHPRKTSACSSTSNHSTTRREFIRRSATEHLTNEATPKFGPAGLDP
jgi:transposase